MSTESAQQLSEASQQDDNAPTKINYSHLADSAETNENYFLHLPGSLSGHKYSAAAKRGRQAKTEKTT
jgi:hypothetical protein